MKHRRSPRCDAGNFYGGLGDFGRNLGAAPGIVVWRMGGGHKPQMLCEQQLGEFDGEGAFLVLHTLQPSVRYDVFLWIGASVGTCERSTAQKALSEVCAALSAPAVVHCENQGHESVKFIALWKQLGGLRSPKSPEGSNRLLRVTGRRYTRMTEVPLSRGSLEGGGLFILDAGSEIFIIGESTWLGQTSSSAATAPGFNRHEVAAVRTAAKRIQDTRDGQARVVSLAEEPGAIERFWAALGEEMPPRLPAPPSVARTAATEIADMPDLLRSKADARLYRQQANGGDVWTEVNSSQGPAPPFRRDSLSSDDVALLYTGREAFGVAVWCGRHVHPARRERIWCNVAMFFKEKSLPSHMPVTLYHEGHEEATFRSFFKQPFETLQVACFGGRLGAPKSGIWCQGVAGRPGLTKLQGWAGSRKGSVNAAYEMLDVGGVTVWRACHPELVEVDFARCGQFFDSNCYLVLHEWRIGGVRKAVIYFWQGAEVQLDDRQNGEALVKRLNKEKFAGKAATMYVTMGREPESFLVLFKGRAIMQRGEAVQGFRDPQAQVGDLETKDTEGDCNAVSCVPEEGGTYTAKPRLYRIMGTNTLNAKAMQVDLAAQSLSSSNAFVLVREGNVPVVWRGKGATSVEVVVGKTVARILCPGSAVDAEVVVQGTEPPWFWTNIGGAGQPEVGPLTLEPELEPRLFRASLAGEKLFLEEAFYFSQADLFSDDVMLLDTYSQLFVWIGANALPSHREGALSLGLQYLEDALDGRPASTPVATVHGGHEPPLFTCHFQSWDSVLRPAKVVESGRQASEPVLQESRRPFPWNASLQGPGVDGKQATQPQTANSRGAGKAAPPGLIRVRSIPTPLRAAHRNRDTANQVRAQSSAAAAPRSPMERMVFADPRERVCTYEELEGVGNRPQDVDPRRKEQYLTEEEFIKVFKVSKDEFASLPAWKQQSAKKAAGLF